MRKYFNAQTDSDPLLLDLDEVVYLTQKDKYVRIILKGNSEAVVLRCADEAAAKELATKIIECITLPETPSNP